MKIGEVYGDVVIVVIQQKSGYGINHVWALVRRSAHLACSSLLFSLSLLFLLFACWWVWIVHRRLPKLSELRLDVQEGAVGLE